MAPKNQATPAQVPWATPIQATDAPNRPDTKKSIELTPQQQEAMALVKAKTREGLDTNHQDILGTAANALRQAVVPAVLAALPGTTAGAQQKPKAPDAQVQVAPTEMASEQDLFTLAKYRAQEDIHDRWPTLDAHQQQQVRKYFALGLKAKLDERNLKKLGLKLMSFYETANEQKRIIMGDDSIQSVLSLTIIGQQLEELLPGSGFKQKWAELDAIIKEYLAKTTAELRKETAELRKKNEELKKQWEILDTLIKRLEKL